MTVAQLMAYLHEKTDMNPDRLNQDVIFMPCGYNEEWKTLDAEEMDFDRFALHKYQDDSEEIVLSGLNNPAAFWALRIGSKE